MSPEEDADAAAIKMFHELADQGCSLRDIVVAIYHQGRHDALGKPPAPRPSKASIVPVCPYDEILDIYHRVLCDPQRDAQLARVKTFDKGRKDAIRKFWVWIFTSTKISSDGTRGRRASNKPEGLTWITRFCELTFQNDHTMGRGDSRKGYETWDPGIEYAFRPDTVRKQIEHTKQARQNGAQHEERRP